MKNLFLKLKFCYSDCVSCCSYPIYIYQLQIFNKNLMSNDAGVVSFLLMALSRFLLYGQVFGKSKKFRTCYLEESFCSISAMKTLGQLSGTFFGICIATFEQVFAHLIEARKWPILIKTPQLLQLIFQNRYF